MSRKKKPEKKTFWVSEWQRILRDFPSFTEEEVKEIFGYPLIIADPRIDSGYL